uniref:Transmembrane protein 131-like conserved domain-containing protein n=1 Tax=Romanomermis culicivorax TaxID=13658 RepID=A0A915L019_ROMCU
MYVQHLSTLSSDPRFFFAPFEKDHGPLVRAKISSQIGRIYFDPLVTCVYDCYVGMPLDTEDGHHWISGLKLPSNLPDIDFELFQKLKSRWNQIVTNREDVINNTVMLDSTLVKNFPIPVETRLGWPRLIKNPAVHFPLTAVGNFTIVNLSLMNPSSLPIVVQILPLTIYPNPEDLIRLFKDELEEAPLTDFVEAEELMMFTLRDSELHNTRPDNWAPLHRRALDQALGTQIPRFTLSVLLQPGMQVGVRLGFLPSDYDMRSSLLLIRF